MKIIQSFLIALLLITISAQAKSDPKNLELKKELLSKWKAYSKASQGAAKGITDAKLIKWMDEDKDFILVDVREPAEVAAGHILAMDFKAIPRGMVAPAIGKTAALKPDQTIVFYCKLGSRSAMAAKEAAEVFGYKNIYYLKGGIVGWVKNGHTVHNKMGTFKGAE
jgi:rhodanese-related sulfurtransferase